MASQRKAVRKQTRTPKPRPTTLATRAVSILEQEWDGLSVDELRAECMKDHKRRVRTDSLTPWDERLVCRYVFRGMICGGTETKLLANVGLDLTGLHRFLKNQSLGEEYAAARRLQARAFAHATDEISTGTDAHSVRIAERIDSILKREIRRAFRRLKKHGQQVLVVRDILAAKAEIRELERGLIQRNKLMIETKRWLAKVTDPSSFSDRTDIALKPADGKDGEPLSLVVEFVDAKNKKVRP